MVFCFPVGVSLALEKRGITTLGQLLDLAEKQDAALAHRGKIAAAIGNVPLPEALIGWAADAVLDHLHPGRAAGRKAATPRPPGPVDGDPSEWKDLIPAGGGPRQDVLTNAVDGIPDVVLDALEARGLLSVAAVLAEAEKAAAGLDLPPRNKLVLYFVKALDLKHQPAGHAADAADAIAAHLDRADVRAPAPAGAEA
jgi:hypothetical protein